MGGMSGRADRLERWKEGDLFAKPGQRRGTVIGGEMANVGFDKMLRQLWRCGEDRTIGHGRDFCDEAMMVSNEPEVGYHRAKRVPPRKGQRVDHDASKAAAFLDVGVNDRGKQRKITRLERPLRPKNENSLVAQQLMVEHAGISSQSSRHQRYTTEPAESNVMTVNDLVLTLLPDK